MNAKATATATTQIEIDGLETADLLDLKHRVEAAMQAKRQARILVFREDTIALAKELDITHGELIQQARLAHSAPHPPAQARATQKVEPKYQNPKTGETWAGRGRKPAWVEAHMQAGGGIEDLAIKN